MENLIKAFDEIKQKKLSIDLTRGKPHADQLDLSNDLITQTVDPIGENGVLELLKQESSAQIFLTAK